MWTWLLAGGLSPNEGQIQANITFISMGFLSAFIFGVESLNLSTSRRQWKTGYESQQQRQIRRISFWSIVLGLTLTVYGLFELNTTIMGCNAYGCGSLPLSDYVSFYLGLSLLEIGPALMLVAKFVQPRFKQPQIETPMSQKV
jgi:hypothetical protein